MVQAWWAAPPVAAAILFNSVFRRKSSRRSKKDDEASRDETGLSFSCERVCTSDTLLKRLGSLAKARRLLCSVLPFALRLLRQWRLTRCGVRRRSPHRTHA
jgi:hypothetical protein